MSELANSERIQKRGWARPGGSHDKLIRVMKIGLPALIGVILAFLFFSPLSEKQVTDSRNARRRSTGVSWRRDPFQAR